jgi:hypothetical protein
MNPTEKQPTRKWIENPFCKEANWVRVDWDDTVPSYRPPAELATNQDLVKTLPQLLCDVHEGLERAQDPEITDHMRHVWMLYSKKSIAALMARSAIDNDKAQGRALSVATGALEYAKLAFIVSAFAVVIQVLQMMFAK